MTSKKPAKPKKLSKTKQELRRLREFAAQFLAEGVSAFGSHRGVVMIQGPALEALRAEAQYALTGRRAPGTSQREEVKETVRKLNAMGPEGLMKFLAGKR